MREERKIVTVAQVTLNQLNKILLRKTPSPLYKTVEAIETFTGHFSDGIEMDVKICNGEPPYIDVILFKAGQELNVLEACEAPIEGEYSLDYKDTRYTLAIGARKFYRAIFQVELLSDSPIEDMSLEDINYCITEGHMSGRLTYVRTHEITARQMARRLISQDSSPEFLGLNKNGKDIGYEY